MSALGVKGNTLEMCHPGPLLCRCGFIYYLFCLGNANSGSRVVLLANAETNILTGENPCNSAPFPNELMKEQD